MQQYQISQRIEDFSGSTLIGLCTTTSYSTMDPAGLWHSFMPRISEISDPADQSLYSVQLYPAEFFNGYNPSTLFEKWAAKAVVSADDVPHDMSILVIPPGKYVVFTYKGSVEHARQAFMHIFNEWFPASSYTVDERPHFEVMTSRYKGNDPESEEEFWIPVKDRILSA